MANYFIIGGDGKEYGPVTNAELRQWINEGRLNAQSQAKAEGETEFRPLATFPEFTDAFSPSTPATIEPLGNAAARPPEARDYDLEIGACLSRGFELLKENFSVLFVSALVYFVIEGALSGLANIPVIGPLFSLGNLIITGPLMGGFFYLFISVNRGHPAEVGTMFEGFRRNFGQLFLGILVPGLFMLLCMIPAIIVLVIKLIPMIAEAQHAGEPSEEAILAMVKSLMLTVLPVFLICAIPLIYLSTSWKFTLPLIIDKQMNCWAAMKLSFKMVNKHWWHIFGLIMIIGLLNVAGIFACCIGLLFTFPIGVGALMAAYETMFGDRNR